MSILWVVRRPVRPARPLLEALEPRSLLATLAVTSLADAGPGSLREAIERANMDADRDTIRFEAGGIGTIGLTRALPDLATSMAIVGPGAGTLTIAARQQPLAPGTRTDAGIESFRVFTIAAGAEVELSGLTITGGRVVGSEGGGILNAGSLTVSDAEVVANESLGTRLIFPAGICRLPDQPCYFEPYSVVAGGGDGGGIANRGALVLRAVVVRDSVGSGLVNDGGTAMADGLSVLTSTLPTDVFTFGGRAAGIVNRSSATLVLDRLEVAGNGSGLVNFEGSTATLRDASLRDNGNAIFSEGTLTVERSTVRGNAGEGLRSQGGTVIVRGSTIAENNLGGIFNSGTITVADSSIWGNRNASQEAENAAGGGGIRNVAEGIVRGRATVINSTISGNRSETLAGGIRNEGDLELIHVTLADNTAVLGGGGVVNSGDGRLAIRNAILAAAPGAGTVVVTGGTVTSGGHNLFSDDPGLVLDLTDRINIDPLLGPLADNGGPTMTHALLPGSPALDGAVAAEGIAVDQRGIPRPQGVAPDIGALELEERFTTPPTVAGLGRLGVHARPTRLVVTFDTAMDPTRAEDTANYRLVDPGRDRRLGTADDRAIAIEAATYDEALRSVTLAPRRLLPLGGTYRLTVSGTRPGGLASASGVALDGAGAGRAGSDFEATFGREILVRPGQEARAARVAERRRRGEEHRSDLLRQQRERQAERRSALEARRAAIEAGRPA